MRDKDRTKKEIADFCEVVYSDESLSPKQITDRLGAMIKRHLKHRNIGIKSERVRVGQHSEVHYSLTNINKKLTGNNLQRAEVTEAHRISNKLREWKDAITALNLPHHLIEKHLDKAARNLEDHIPEFSKMLSPEMDVATLRDNWKILYKNERRGPNRSAVVKALQDIRVEHHAYYLIQPIYVWVRKTGTSLDREKRDSNVKNQIKVNPDFALEISEKLLNTSLEKELDANKFDLAVAISIATGRRRTEIFKTAVFDVLETTPGNHVLFHGQLKTHDRELFGDVKPYPIPCLVPRDLVVNGLLLLRKIQKKDSVSYLDQRGNEVTEGVLDQPLTDQYHNEAVGKFYSHAANDRIRYLFETPSIEFRHSRDMYSEIGYDKFKKDGEGRSAYRTRVYGHAKGQAETGRAYEKFEISTDVEKASFICTGKETVSSDQNKPVVDILNEWTPKIENWKRSPNAIRIHKWLIEELEKGLPVESITASYIRKYIMLPDVQQLNLRSIQTYLSDKWINWEELKTKALDEPVAIEEEKENIDDEIDMIECEEESEAEEHEPEKETSKETKVPQGKFRPPHQNEDGTWNVIFSVDGEEFSELVEEAKNMWEAGTKAWKQWEFKQSLPKKMPVPITKKVNGWWLSQIKHQGEVIFEAMTKSKKSAEDSVINQFTAAKK